MKKLMILLSMAAVAAGTRAAAYDEDAERMPTPISIGLASVLKLPPFDRDVWGIKLNVPHSRQLNVYGVDAGLIGCNTGTMAGIQANAFDWVDGDACGLQVGVVGNYVSGGVYGLQVGGLLSYNLGDTYGVQISTLNFDGVFRGLEIGALNWNYAGTDGVQIGVVNAEKHDMTGASFGALNYCHGNLEGGQIGVINLVNGPSHGFQLGLVNAAQNLCGVQIGLVNVNVFGRLPIMVIANANF